jgi:hypothetical protein
VQVQRVELSSSLLRRVQVSYQRAWPGGRTLDELGEKVLLTQCVIALGACKRVQIEQQLLLKGNPWPTRGVAR